MKIVVVIPAFNKADAIGDVVRVVPADRTQSIVVVDNDSTDDNAMQAALAGARVFHEPHCRYGSAYLAGTKAAKDIDIIVLLYGDRSNDPHQMDAIATPGEAKIPYS
jgi:glycosyltransferase involved in cell wall biosynthesis